MAAEAAEAIQRERTAGHLLYPSLSRQAAAADRIFCKGWMAVLAAVDTRWIHQEEMGDLEIRRLSHHRKETTAGLVSLLAETAAAAAAAARLPLEQTP